MKSFDIKWEKIHQELEWGKYPSEDVIRFIARNYFKRERKEVRILDYGCGAGSNTWFLAREGFDVYAFDGSITAVKKAKERLENESLYANFIVADAMEINYQKNFFDCIIDSAVIYGNCIANIIAIYQNIYSILKKGGKILSTGLFTTNTSGYGTGEKIEDNTYRNITEGALTNRGTVHFFETKSEIYDMLSKIGFSDISIDCIKRSDQNGSCIIEYYIVSAVK